MHTRHTLAFLISIIAACSPPQLTRPVVLPSTAAAERQIAAAPGLAAEPPTPLDPQIRRTTLKNGLTVYVMPHRKPEQRAALWLAVNAGSVLEDDDQRGLAHFVEHMAFNGTRRFAKQAIIDYIEKIGMRFGPDVNAYTSFDQTVYMLTVPTDDAKMMATGLDILRDWAGDVSFDPVEVDKERGVVLEEWRGGRGAFARIRDKQWPVMFQGSKYAERLPIGLPEVLKTAPRAALVRFYERWYRPENMAVIAVGDFDAAAMEREIEARFAGLGAGTTGKSPARPAVLVPHHHPTAVTITTDPEMPYSRVEVVDKLDHRPEATRSDYRRLLVERVYHGLLRARFQELALAADSPFTFAGSWTSDLTRAADGFIRYANAKQGKTAEALAALGREIKRVEQHGFTQAELDRAVSEVLANAETNAAEWDKTHSGMIADELTANFFEGEQLPGRPVELTFARELLPTVTRAELNQLAAKWGDGTGRVIAIAGPANAGLPTEADARRLFAEAQAEKLEPWQDDPVRPLMTTLPTPGKVTRTTRDAGAEATVWTLANGVRVIVKPTAFQNDEIEIQGFKAGGSSLVKDDLHARFAAQVIAAGGVGDLDPTALQKTLKGKVAYVHVGLSELAETVRGWTRPADLETALQLVHLRLTAPRKDERAFAAWRAEQLEWAQNRRLLPEVSFYEDMEAVRTNNHPRRRPLTPEMLAKIDLERAEAVYSERFADLGAMTFVIVGNVELAGLQPLVERYLGSLPSTGKSERWRDIGVEYATGKVNRQVVQGREPKSYVTMTFGGPDRWTREASHDARVLGMVLQIRLREVLREDMGGVYGVRSSVALSREPTGRREATISFGCDPANVETLRDAALAVLRTIQKEGISDEYLVKVREQLRRGHETDARENWWWSRQLRDAYWFGEDLATTTALAPVIARVTSAHVKAAAQRFFAEKNLVFGVLRPEPATAP